MRIRLLSAFALLFFMAGCASYNSSSAPALNATTAKVTYNQEGVGLIADPYLDAPRQTKYFNADFKKSGMLVVHLLVKNDGADSIEIRRSNIHLRLPDGTEIADMGATTAATQVGENGSVVAERADRRLYNQRVQGRNPAAAR